MKLNEIAVQEERSVYIPTPIETEGGEIHQVITFYSYEPKHTGKKTFSLETDEAIFVDVLGEHYVDNHEKEEDDRVVKVRFINEPDRLLSKFSIIRQEYTLNADGEPITLRLKEIPYLTNFDLYTDDEFFEEFGTTRTDEDRGLIGYVIDDHNFRDAELAPDELDDGDPDFGGPGEPGKDERPDKLTRAINIYRANRHKQRKQVIDLIRKHLNMSQAGASSYYTKAKHAVEDD